MNFKKGDEVVLKSGSLAMVVAWAFKFNGITRLICCKWVAADPKNEDRNKSGMFLPELLRKNSD